MEWDAADLKGNYRVRWTFAAGYREFPVTIVGQVHVLRGNKF